MDNWDTIVESFERQFGKARYLTVKEFQQWSRIKSRKTIDNLIKRGRLEVSCITNTGERRFSKTTALNYYIGSE